MLRTLSLLAGLAVALLAAPSALAQPCADAGDTFWKNDLLADNPVGQGGAQVLIALCEGEAAGTVFRPAAGSPPQHLKQVSFGYGHITDDDTFVATTNVEIYVGEPGWNPGAGISMGTKIFDLQADTGTTFDMPSTGFSSLDVSEHNIIVDDTFVVVFRMLTNSATFFPGACPAATQGTPANFLTDGSGCTPQINVLDERTVGWVDPTDWQFAIGQTICPTFYSGNWAIRACTEDAGVWTDEGNALAGTLGDPTMVGSGPLTEGSLNPLTLDNTLPNTGTFLVVGFSGLFAPLKGGVLVPVPDLLFAGIPTNGAGTWTIQSPWPAGVPAGFVLYWQAWIPDAAGPVGFAASNGVSSTTP